MKGEIDAIDELLAADVVNHTGLLQRLGVAAGP
jgi:hypothetical protein